MNYQVEFQDVNVSYGSDIALQNINLQIPKNEIFGIIGPANAGKTTFLKAINRTLEFIHNAKTKGNILFNGTNVRSLRNVYELRRKVGVVFPLPVGLPMSIFENVAYAPRRSGIHDMYELEELVQRCLQQAMLWDEVKDRLHMLGTKLSGGQQQRLTIARALSHSPDVLIMLVTNLVQQARRLADQTAFFNKSELVEYGPTEKLFTSPDNQLTYDYVTGDFG